MPWVRIFGKLFVCKFDAFGGFGEPEEKERIGSLREKVVLRFLRVFVHSVTHSGKRNDCLLQKFIVSVDPVCHDKHFKKFNEFCLLFVAHLLRQIAELSLAESCKRLLHCAKLPSFASNLLTLSISGVLHLVKERLIGLLVELTHGAESRTIEEEVELLVELFAALLGPLGIGSKLARLF